MSMDEIIRKIQEAENRLLEMVYDPGKNYELHIFPYNLDFNTLSVKKLYNVDAKEYVCTLITECKDDKVTVKMIRPDVDSITNLENSVTGE